jgi:hypothetical protein
LKGRSASCPTRTAAGSCSTSRRSLGWYDLVRQTVYSLRSIFSHIMCSLCPARLLHHTRRPSARNLEPTRGACGGARRGARDLEPAPPLPVASRLLALRARRGRAAPPRGGRCFRGPRAPVTTLPAAPSPACGGAPGRRRCCKCIT